MPTNGPPDDDDNDKQNPPSTDPYVPTGPQPIPWRSWLTWFVRGFARRFASVSLAPVGRGLELAAAGLLVTGIIVSWQFGAPPFANSQEKSSCEHHHCCHGAVQGTIENQGVGAPVSGEPASTEDTGEHVTTSNRQAENQDHDRGEQGGIVAAQCLSAAGEGSAPTS